MNNTAKRISKKGDWAVVMTWEECGVTRQFMVAENLREREAMDMMIEKERIHKGTGRSFTCLQEVR